MLLFLGISMFGHHKYAAQYIAKNNMNQNAKCKLSAYSYG